jgi:frataxin-like iron-binding protein CyaY
MQRADIAKPALLLVGIIIVITAGTGFTALGLSGGPSQPDSDVINGQSPEQFQPANINPDADPEAGQISLAAASESKRILIDTDHGNRFDRTKLQPIIETLVERGHTVRFSGDIEQLPTSTGQSSSFASALSDFDAVMIFYPTEQFSNNEIDQLRTFTNTGGRVVMLGGPSELDVSTSLFGSSVSSVQFAGNSLLERYGMRIDSDLLYNTNDERTDNNYKSIYVEPSEPDSLTQGVDTVNLDSSGSIVIAEKSPAKQILRATEGTQRFSTRRSGQYVTAARTTNFVAISDTTFMTDTDVYDVDNEQFISNLLTFLISGNKANFPQSSGSANSSNTANPVASG